MRGMEPRFVFDPCCQMLLRPDDAIVIEVRGEARWFCGEECASKFLDAPWRYEDEEFDDRQPVV